MEYAYHNYEYDSSDDDDNNTNDSDDSNNGEYKQSKNTKRNFEQKEFNKKRQIITGEPLQKQRWLGETNIPD